MAVENTAIGIGMWLGIIMAYNVWFIIWPNQKKALGIIEASAEEKPIAAKKAMLTSRINTLLSFPMLTYNGSCSKPLLTKVIFYLLFFKSFICNLQIF